MVTFQNEQSILAFKIYMNKAEFGCIIVLFSLH